MSESKFTPGPWKAGGKFMTLVINHLGWNITSGYMVVDLEESQANTRLIAAAPDMYAALELAMAFLDNSEYATGVERDVYKLAEMALAKADGK